MVLEQVSNVAIVQQNMLYKSNNYVASSKLCFDVTIFSDCNIIMLHSGSKTSFTCFKSYFNQISQLIRTSLSFYVRSRGLRDAVDPPRLRRWWCTQFWKQTRRLIRAEICVTCLLAADSYIIRCCLCCRCWDCSRLGRRMLILEILRRAKQLQTKVVSREIKIPILGTSRDGNLLSSFDCT